MLDLLRHQVAVSAGVKQSELGQRVRVPRPYDTAAQAEEQLASVTEIRAFFKG